MNTILVTGGAGFIGSHVVEHLLDNEYSVVIIDNLSSGNIRNIPTHKNIKFIKADINDADILESIANKIDAVIHLAAQVSVSVSVDQPVLSASTNVIGFLKILELAKHRSIPLVYASSAAVYGTKATVPVTEATMTSPTSPYGLEKLINEQYSKLFFELYGYKSTGLRFFNVYGPRQDPSSQYSGVISIFTNRISQGLDITIYGDGNQTRDFIYVKDVADSIVIALQKNEQGVINVATGKETTLNDLAAKVAKLSSKELLVKHKSSRIGDIRYSYADNSRLKSLGKTTFVPLDAGLTQLLNYI